MEVFYVIYIPVILESMCKSGKRSAKRRQHAISRSRYAWEHKHLNDSIIRRLAITAHSQRLLQDGSWKGQHQWTTATCYLGMVFIDNEHCWLLITIGSSTSFLWRSSCSWQDTIHIRSDRLLCHHLVTSQSISTSTRIIPSIVSEPIRASICTDILTELCWNHHMYASLWSPILWYLARLYNSSLLLDLCRPFLSRSCINLHVPICQKGNDTFGYGTQLDLSHLSSLAGRWNSFLYHESATSSISNVNRSGRFNIARFSFLGYFTTIWCLYCTTIQVRTSFCQSSSRWVLLHQSRMHQWSDCSSFPSLASLQACLSQSDHQLILSSPSFECQLYFPVFHQLTFNFIQQPLKIYNNRL